jgi:hypothetical protein
MRTLSVLLCAFAFASSSWASGGGPHYVAIVADLPKVLEPSGASALIPVDIFGAEVVIAEGVSVASRDEALRLACWSMVGQYARRFEQLKTERLAREIHRSCMGMAETSSIACSGSDKVIAVSNGSAARANFSIGGLTSVGVACRADDSEAVWQWAVEACVSSMTTRLQRFPGFALGLPKAGCDGWNTGWTRQLRNAIVGGWAPTEREVLALGALTGPIVYSSTVKECAVYPGVKWPTATGHSNACERALQADWRR